MSEDFLRLVSRATHSGPQQYQPGSSGYPPTVPYADLSLNDPFFDDEEDYMPMPIRSQESGLPLSHATIDPSQGLLQGWNFDSHDPALKPHPKSESIFPRLKSRRWPWQKDQILIGERVVTLNDNAANDFCSNFVSTAKYSLVSFLPKFLFEQFSKFANLFFLFIATIQQIPNISPTNRYTTIVPLVVVLVFSAFKEIWEDLKRHQSDTELNSRKTKILTSDANFVETKWKDVQVGDVVRLESDDFIPSDMILLSSSEPEGLCYIETSNLDGETNLKFKQASTHTASLANPRVARSLNGTLRSEQPNNSLYTYEGTFDLRTPTDTRNQVPLGPDQFLPRGAQVRNTNWLYGLTVFTGRETKMMRNAISAPIKRTALERQVAVQIGFLFILLLALALASTIGSSIRSWSFSNSQWYLFDPSSLSGRAKHFFKDILTFVILYNNLIPISLIVTMDVVKSRQAEFINSDIDLYDAKTDTPAFCRTSSLVEDLGQIEFVFSDKTGTLTCNEMEFRCCSIAGISFAERVDDDDDDEQDGEDGKRGRKTFKELQEILSGPFEAPPPLSESDRELIQEFCLLLAVCHTVIPKVKDDGKILYQASSPDEVALVTGAGILGFQFQVRKPESVFINIQGQSQKFDILNVCEFTSTRKRMSTVVQGPDGKIKVYTKGADTVILECLSKNQPYMKATLAHLEEYATEGLRTLCMAFRNISKEEYEQWSEIYIRAASMINGRGEALDKAAELIEKNLFLLGATAIEDKLQDGVPDTIHTLQRAGIKVWVLTGDRQETAINIAMSCRLISESMNLVIANEESANDTREFLSKRLTAIKSQRSTGELEDLALVIDGTSLGFALKRELSDIFLELAFMCKAVICCRVSPLQKALVVKLVKRKSNAHLLAIGDGANDISMIQAAHVGVGISGVEGLQAARSADITLSQFRFLNKLLLVHGAWSYRRLSRLILYSFYKNIMLYMTLFWYSFFNGFSGQIAFESWSYNLLFTVLPPLVIGSFDQFVCARFLDRYPELYALGQQNMFFTKISFWLWSANALYHSVLCFGFSVILFWGDMKFANGLDSGLWAWGTTLYLMVLLTVLGKAAIICDIWTKYTFAAIPGSLMFTMLFLPVYAIIVPATGFLTEYTGIVPLLWTNSVFYFVLIFVPLFCLLRDIAWKYYQRTYMPWSYHIVQEIQKYNIPAYRPRHEQFQKAIKKVRATQRMRRNRGFAFSQTENAGEQVQAKIIRAYDTSMTAGRPSGY